MRSSYPVVVAERNPSPVLVSGLVMALAAGIGYTAYWYVSSGRAYSGKVLQVGTSGSAVQAMKRRLIEHGYGPPPSEPANTFGPDTASAVKRFQTAFGLPATGIVDPATWDKLIARPPKKQSRYSVAQLIRAMKKKGYRVEEDGKWNILGIRSNTGTTNTYDDEMHVFRKVGGKWDHAAYAITTDPGMYYLLQPMNSAGTSAVAPGQYPDSHGFGIHRGSYEALTQKGMIKAYRDPDRNNVYNFDDAMIVTCTGCGINIHKASANGVTVDKGSAGCQVFARSADFDEFMAKMKQSGQSLFTYTLMNAREM